MNDQIVEQKLGIPPDYQYKAIRSKNFLQANWHKNKFNALSELVTFTKDMRVLDIGTGSGNFELLYHDKVGEIVGIDYNADAIAFLQSKLDEQNVINVRVQKVDIRKANELNPLGTFDVIIMVDVIEHISISDGEKLIASLRHNLKKDGYFIVITPNYRSAWVYIEALLDKVTIVPKFAGEQHLAKYFPKNLTRLFTKHGFLKHHLTTINTWSFPVPWYKASHALLRTEVRSAVPWGNLLAAVYKYSPEQNATHIETWKKKYASDQSGLYRNPLVRLLFNSGHQWIAKAVSKKDKVVADLGCGIGYHLQFEDIASTKKYICIDSDVEMLKKLPPTVTTLQADVQKIPLPDASVDVVIASHILEHIPDVDTTLSEIDRILTTEGCALIVLPCDPGLAWDTLTAFSPSRKRLKDVNLDYDMVMSVEHLNDVQDIVTKLSQNFTLSRIDHLPLHFLKSSNLNIMLGMIAQKKTSVKASQNNP